MNVAGMEMITRLMRTVILSVIVEIVLLIPIGWKATIKIVSIIEKSATSVVTRINLCLICHVVNAQPRMTMFISMHMTGNMNLSQLDAALKIIDKYKVEDV